MLRIVRIYTASISGEILRCQSNPRAFLIFTGFFLIFVGKPTIFESAIE